MWRMNVTLAVTDDIPVLNVQGGSDTVTVEDEKMPYGNDEADGGVASLNGSIVDNVAWGADEFGSATGFDVGAQHFASGTTVYWSQTGVFQGTNSPAVRPRSTRGFRFPRSTGGRATGPPSSPDSQANTAFRTWQSNVASIPYRRPAGVETESGCRPNSEH